MNRYLLKIATIYQEGSDSSFTHDGKVYALNPVLRKSSVARVVKLPVGKLRWVLGHDVPDPSRVASADTSIPILVYNDPRWGLTVIDGLHRLSKAVDSGESHIPARLVRREWLTG